MVEHTAQCVLGVITLGGQFYSLADGDAKTAAAIGVFGQDLD